jgi:hypothetical protein
MLAHHDDRQCKGHRQAFDVCNWLVGADSSEQYCTACRHNRTVPDPQQPGTIAAWYKLEVAKHRLFYTLMRLKLALESRSDIGEKGLASLRFSCRLGRHANVKGDDRP